jgi:hypothetical protein
MAIGAGKFYQAGLIVRNASIDSLGFREWTQTNIPSRANVRHFRGQSKE